MGQRLVHSHTCRDQPLVAHRPGAGARNRQREDHESGVDRHESVLRLTRACRRDCCGDRLSNFEVKVGNTDSRDGNTKCGDLHSVAQGQTLDVYCSGAVGRYVFVVIPGSSKTLTLCEVEVNAVDPAASEQPCYDGIACATQACANCTGAAPLLRPREGAMELRHACRGRRSRPDPVHCVRRQRRAGAVAYERCSEGGHLPVVHRRGASEGDPRCVHARLVALAGCVAGLCHTRARVVQEQGRSRRC